MCSRYEYIKQLEEYHKMGKIQEDIYKIVDSIKAECPSYMLKREEKTRGKVYYRFERNLNDAYPYFISKPQLFKKLTGNSNRSSSRINACKMCGLSIFSDINELITTIKEKFNNARVKILRCENIEVFGEVYITPSKQNKSHRTFFPCAGYEPDAVWDETQELNNGSS